MWMLNLQSNLSSLTTKCYQIYMLSSKGYTSVYITAYKSLNLQCSSCIILMFTHSVACSNSLDSPTPILFYSSTSFQETLENLPLWSLSDPNFWNALEDFTLLKNVISIVDFCESCWSYPPLVWKLFQIIFSDLKKNLGMNEKHSNLFQTIWVFAGGRQLHSWV